MKVFFTQVDKSSPESRSMKTLRGLPLCAPVPPMWTPKSSMPFCSSRTQKVNLNGACVPRRNPTILFSPATFKLKTSQVPRGCRNCRSGLSTWLIVLGPRSVCESYLPCISPGQAILVLINDRKSIQSASQPHASILSSALYDRICLKHSCAGFNNRTEMSCANSPNGKSCNGKLPT